MRILVYFVTEPTSNKVGSAYTQKCITGLCWSLLGLYRLKKVAENLLNSHNSTENHLKHSSDVGFRIFSYRLRGQFNDNYPLRDFGEGFCVTGA